MDRQKKKRTNNQTDKHELKKHISEAKNPNILLFQPSITDVGPWPNIIVSHTFMTPPLPKRLDTMEPASYKLAQH